MSLDGDFSRLDRLIAACDMAAAGGVRRAILERTAPVVADLVRATFAAQRSPNGPRWRRLKGARERGRPILRKSDTLFEYATRVVPVGDSLVIAIPLPYAQRHLYGDASTATQGRDSRGRFSSILSGIPQRQYLPLGDALPRRWQSRVNTVATDLWRNLFL